MADDVTRLITAQLLQLEVDQFHSSSSSKDDDVVVYY